MYKKVLTFTVLLLQNTSIYAMDLNETTIIIHEASEATLILQNEFNSLINELPTSPIIEVNTTIQEPFVEVIPNITIHRDIEFNNSIKGIQNLELNNIIEPRNSPILKEEIFSELNSSIDINNKIIIEKLHANKKSSCNKDNGCTDANLGTSARGLIIYKTRIKPYCEITGEKFAKQYMQEDWDDIYHDKEFRMEVIRACPKMEKRYRDKWTPHLYQFTLEYASDSDAIPEC